MAYKVVGSGEAAAALSPDVLAALTGAALPSATNVFATQWDLIAVLGGMWDCTTDDLPAEGGYWVGQVLLCRGAGHGRLLSHLYRWTGTIWEEAGDYTWRVFFLRPDMLTNMFYSGGVYQDNSVYGINVIATAAAQDNPSRLVEGLWDATLGPLPSAAENPSATFFVCRAVQNTGLDCGLYTSDGDTWASVPLSAWPWPLFASMGRGNYAPPGGTLAGVYAWQGGASQVGDVTTYDLRVVATNGSEYGGIVGAVQETSTVVHAGSGTGIVGFVGNPFLCRTGTLVLTIEPGGLTFQWQLGTEPPVTGVLISSVVPVSLTGLGIAATFDAGSYVAADTYTTDLSCEATINGLTGTFTAALHGTNGKTDVVRLTNTSIGSMSRVAIVHTEPSLLGSSNGVVKLRTYGDAITMSDGHADIPVEIFGTTTGSTVFDFLVLNPRVLAPVG